MYESYDPSTVMLFLRNKHIIIHMGTGNSNKINWALEDKQEMIDIVGKVFGGASTTTGGQVLQVNYHRGQVVSLKDYSTKYRFRGTSRLLGLYIMLM